MTHLISPRHYVRISRAGDRLLDESLRSPHNGCAEPEGSAAPERLREEPRKLRASRSLAEQQRLVELGSC